MSLRNWKCQKCNEVVQSFDQAPVHCDEPMKITLSAPSAKFMEPRSPGKKSVLKDQTKTLRARARDHARNFELDELIATNSKETARKNEWITKDGRKRRKIDDI